MTRLRVSVWAIGLFLLAAPSSVSAQTPLDDDLQCCEQAYESCNEGCRQLEHAWQKALCWPACTVAYGECRLAAELRNRLLPKKPRCGDNLEDDSSSSEPCTDDGDGSSGSGGGGDNGGGGGPSCHQEYIYVDVDYGDGNWITVWEGWASVCQ